MEADGDRRGCARPIGTRPEPAIARFVLQVIDPSGHWNVKQLTWCSSKVQQPQRKEPPPLDLHRPADLRQ